jgi:hypothetical protein
MQNPLDSLPNIVIFDFLYGVAAYNCWKSASILGTMEEYYVDHYEFIPVPTPSTLSEEDSFSKPYDYVIPLTLLSHVPKTSHFLKDRECDGESDGQPEYCF